VSEQGFEEMGFAPRLMRRIQSRGTRGDIIKSLAELIKNADDAYDRLELEGKKTSGLIEIGFWRLVKERRSSVSGFYVRDYGPGMTLNQAHKSYGKAGYGEDTSDNTRNGAIGVGGKDAFYGMKDCLVITIQDGVAIVIEIKTNEKGLLTFKISENQDALDHITKVNKTISPNCKPISLMESGTFVKFEIPENHVGIRMDTLHIHLSNYYTLRNILTFNFRTVKLIEINTGQALTLRHLPIEGEIIYEKTLTIPYRTKSYDVDIIINKAEHDLDQQKEMGTCILIEDIRGAILDNTMFGYENEPAADKMFGKVTIHNWKSLYRDDQTVLTDNREGLDYNNDFNKLLKGQMLQILKPLIEKEREKQGTNPQLEKHLDQNIQKTFAFINKLMQKDPDEGIEEPSEFETPPEGIEFAKSTMTIPPNVKKSLKLFLNPSQVPTNSKITTMLSGDGITVEPSGTITTPSSYEEKIPFVVFNIVGNKTNTKSTLKAFYSELEAEVDIYVKPEEMFYPNAGFAFVSKSITLVKNKKKKIKLVIDTNIIKPGTAIDIQSEDERIEVSPNKLTVSFPPKLGKYLTEEVIEVSTRTSSLLSTRIIANTKTTMNEDRQAVCKIKVAEKEPPKVFFKGYRLDNSPEGDKRQRYRFSRDTGIVYVHVNAPILKNYFGITLSKIHDREPDAVAMLADTVVQCVTKEWAKWRIEKDKEEVLGDPQTEVERVANRLEYQYGAQMHQMIMHGHMKEFD